MIEQTLARLDQLAQTDPTLAPLARLQAEAVRASADRAWEDGVPDLDRRQAEHGVPREIGFRHGQLDALEHHAIQVTGVAIDYFAVERDIPELWQVSLQQR